MITVTLTPDEQAQIANALYTLAVDLERAAERDDTPEDHKHMFRQSAGAYRKLCAKIEGVA